MDWNQRWLLRGFLFYLALIALIGVPAYISYAQQTIQLRPGDAGPIIFDTSGNSVFTSGHILSTAPPPVLSGCGGGSPTIVGSDLSGTVVTGTSATGCVITFARAFAAAPACVLSPASGVLASFSYTISTSAITVTQTSSSGNTITYICIGKQ